MPPRFFRPGRIARGIVRRNVARSVLRHYRRKRARRWLIGGAILLAIAGTHRAVKLREEDARRLENHYGRPIDELNEDEINQGMQYYNMQPLTIEDDDRKRIYDEDNKNDDFYSQNEKYCINCGTVLLGDAKFCQSCGARV
ncbi:MAG TPA: zinc ribbon domain-containing protein [Candidatus Bathyarchaeia archaeon]|nr:zinc ribbon domain-containing protein [Candidatus Bathyarchaeia archaeon]